MSDYALSLRRVEVFSSCTLSAPLDLVWVFVRQFGNAVWLSESPEHAFSIHPGVSPPSPRLCDLWRLASDSPVKVILIAGCGCLLQRRHLPSKVHLLTDLNLSDIVKQNKSKSAPNLQKTHCRNLAPLSQQEYSPAIEMDQKAQIWCVQSGAASTEVGSTRVFGVGAARLHEQLVALDDAEHRLWVANLTTAWKQYLSGCRLWCLELLPILASYQWNVEYLWKGMRLLSELYSVRIGVACSRSAQFESVSEYLAGSGYSYPIRRPSAPSVVPHLWITEQRCSLDLSLLACSPT